MRYATFSDVHLKREQKQAEKSSSHFVKTKE